MRYVILTIVSFFCLVLQDTLFNDFSVAGGKPDFLLIIVVFFAIFNGPVKGGWLGLILGLLEDLMLGRCPYFWLAHWYIRKCGVVLHH